MKRIIISFIAALFAAAAWAELETTPYTCHWTGENSSNYWDPKNWREGKVPGVYTTEGTDAEGNTIVVTNGCRGCTAIFGRVPNSKLDQRRLIVANQYNMYPDQANMVLSVGNIIFDAAAEAEYPDNVEVQYVVNETLTWTWGEPYMPLEGGSKIEVTANQTKDVQFLSSLCLGSLETSSQTYTFINDSAAAILSFKNLTDGADTADAYSPSGRWGKGVTAWLNHKVRMEGSGEIQILPTSITRSGEEYSIQMAMNGGKLVYPNGSTIFSLYTAANVGEQVIEVSEGKVVQLDCSNSGIANIYSDLRITGAGTFKVQSGSGNNRQVGLYNGAKLKVECALGNRQTSGTYCGELPGIWLQGSGFFSQTGENQIQGAVELYEGVTYIAPVIGMVGSSSGMGAGQKIRIGSSSTLRYTGTGETTDKIISLSGGGGIIAQAGTGTLVFPQVIADYSDYKLTVTNMTDSYVGFSGNVAANLILYSNSKVKFFPPTADEKAISVSYLTFYDGTTVVVDEGLASLTISRLVPMTTDAKLNLIVTDGTRVLLPNATKGYNGNLLLNGAKARIYINGQVLTYDSDDETIAARGDYVTDLPNGVVAITRAGGEDDDDDELNCESGSTSVSMFALRNRVSDQVPVIALAEGERLKASVFETVTGAAPIFFSGEGSLGEENASIILRGTIGRTNKTYKGAFTLSSDEATMQLDGAASAEHSMTNYIWSGNVKLSSTGEPTLTNAFIEVRNSTAASLELTGDETVANAKLKTGAYAGTVGAIYQTGGTLLSTCKGDGDGACIAGFSGYGYYKLVDGLITNTYGASFFGGWGLAVFEQTGGIFHQATSGFSLRAYSTNNVAVAYQSGGQMIQSTSTDINLDSRSGGTVIWTVDGADSLVKARTRNVALGTGGANDIETTAILNINNEGTVHTGSIASAPKHSVNTHTYLNFNGGVLKNDYSYSGIFSEPNNQYFDPLDKVTVFSGGAIFDIGADCNVQVPISAPTGKGVSAIAWNDATTVFPGAPIVLIEGDGVGATAFAHFDRETGHVTSIEVTSPGWNYTEAVAVVYSKNDSNRKKIEAARAACTLTDNVSGGITKKGGGRLELKVVSTYTGPTVVKAGTLKLEIDNAISSESALVLDGGTLNLNDHLQTFSDIDCNGGAIAGGKPSVTALKVDFPKAVAGTAKQVDTSICTLPQDLTVTVQSFDETALASLRKVELVNFVNGAPASLDVAGVTLPEFWEVGVKSNKLMLYKKSPTILLLK